MKVYGLLGQDLSYSFSKSYFTEKFKNEQINALFENFVMKGVSEFPSLLEKHPDISGLTVTIPFKKSILCFLNEIDSEVEAIGAVNVLAVQRYQNNFFLKGYNSDVYGFEKSLTPLLHSENSNALILGTGGAAQAVAYVLKKLSIPFCFVSRNPNGTEMIDYSSLTETLINQNLLIINTTPLGTANGQYYEQLRFPTQWLSKNHLCYDLVYNPEKTRFLREAEEMGARIKNGHEMLILQAEKAWEIWNQ